MHLKVFVKLKKTLKPSRLGKKTQKKPKKPKNPKTQKKKKKTHRAVFFLKTRVFPNPAFSKIESPPLPFPFFNLLAFHHFSTILVLHHPHFSSTPVSSFSLLSP